MLSCACASDKHGSSPVTTSSRAAGHPVSVLGRLALIYVTKSNLVQPKNFQFLPVSDWTLAAGWLQLEHPQEVLNSDIACSFDDFAVTTELRVAGTPPRERFEGWSGEKAIGQPNMPTDR